MSHQDCTVPFRFGRRYGDRWTCPVCGVEWSIRSNQYDSLLPFGDYQWFSTPPRLSRLERFLGTTGKRARLIQPEPCIADRSRLAELLHITDTLGVSHQTVLGIYDRNPSADLPYHGAAHGITVALRSAQAAREMGESVDGQRRVLIAGLYHDFGYIVGDAEETNIDRASAYIRSLGLDEADSTEVARLIRATHFPHQHPADDLEAIIQDADLLQGIEPDGDRFRDGLTRESGVPALVDFPRIDMLNTQHARDRHGRRFRRE